MGQGHRRHARATVVQHRDEHELAVTKQVEESEKSLLQRMKDWDWSDDEDDDEGSRGRGVNVTRDERDGVAAHRGTDGAGTLVCFSFLAGR